MINARLICECWIAILNSTSVCMNIHYTVPHNCGWREDGRVYKSPSAEIANIFGINIPTCYFLLIKDLHCTHFSHAVNYSRQEAGRYGSHRVEIGA